jgi:hypothetical protein
VERAAVVRERGPVGVAHGGELLEGEGDGAVGRGEGGELHGRHGDGGGLRAVEEEQRHCRAARCEEEEEDGHEARGHRGGGGGAGARGRVVVWRQLRRRSGHGGRRNLGCSWWEAEEGGGGEQSGREGGHLSLFTRALARKQRQRSASPQRWCLLLVRFHGEKKLSVVVPPSMAPHGQRVQYTGRPSFTGTPDSPRCQDSSIVTHKVNFFKYMLFISAITSLLYIINFLK